jgi:hypothetical protein
MTKTDEAGKFQTLGQTIGKVVDDKQAAYGNSFGTTGAAFRLLYPKGITPDQMDDALTLVRIWDKMMRIATDRDALGESPYRDIVGYGLLGAARVEAAQPAKDKPAASGAAATTANGTPF